MCLISLHCFKPQTELEVSAMVIPSWLELILKTKGITLENLMGGSDESVLNILSERDVTFHSDVTWMVNRYLFEQNTYEEKQRIFGLLKEVWFAIPMSSDYALELVPRVVAPNLIVITGKTGDEADESLNTDIYERLLQCYHNTATAQHGTSVWSSQLLKAILGKIQPSE